MKLMQITLCWLMWALNPSAAPISSGRNNSSLLLARPKRMRSYLPSQSFQNGVVWSHTKTGCLSHRCLPAISLPLFWGLPEGSGLGASLIYLQSRWRLLLKKIGQMDFCCSNIRPCKPCSFLGTEYWRFQIFYQSVMT